MDQFQVSFKHCSAISIQIKAPNSSHSFVPKWAIRIKGSPFWRTTKQGACKKEIDWHLERRAGRRLSSDATHSKQHRICAPCLGVAHTTHAHVTRCCSGEVEGQAFCARRESGVAAGAIIRWHFALAHMVADSSYSALFQGVDYQALETRT